MKPPGDRSRITRRDAAKAMGKALAGVATAPALPRLSGVRAFGSVESRAEATTATPASDGGAFLRIASCQFPVSGEPAENAKYVRGFLEQAAAGGANLLHTSVACLSGYAGTDFRSF